MSVEGDTRSLGLALGGGVTALDVVSMHIGTRAGMAIATNLGREPAEGYWITGAVEIYAVIALFVSALASSATPEEEE